MGGRAAARCGAVVAMAVLLVAACGATVPPGVPASGAAAVAGSAASTVTSRSTMMSASGSVSGSGSGSASPRPTPRPTPRLSSSPSPSPSPAATSWHPRKGATWQWQLDGTANLSVSASVFDLDVDDTPASTVARLHAMGRRVICYVDVGTWESYRADAAKFPKRVLGKAVDGWPDERWLDIRQLSVIEPLIARRLDTCARKGFDAVEPDWLDAYDQATGFAITRAESIRFDLWVAHAAHARGLSVAQKNAPGLVTALHLAFDFAVTEDCAYYAECTSYRAYLARGRAVLDAEYIWGPATFCPRTKPLGVSAIAKRLSLDAWRKTCP